MWGLGTCPPAIQQEESHPELAGERGSRTEPRHGVSLQQPVKTCAEMSDSGGVSIGRCLAHLGVPEDVPLANIHIFCNQEYYGNDR